MKKGVFGERLECKGAVMKAIMQATMQAAAIDRFGGIENISVQSLSVPQAGPEEVLIRVESAGVGVWDPFEIEGGFAEMTGETPKFPYVPGSEGAGTIVEVGERVTDFKEGDHVYALALGNPKGGFYAQYAAVPADHVSRIGGRLSVEEAGAMPVDAVTALIGLDQVLQVKRGTRVLIFGASGGIGHMAVQLAKRMGAVVLAAASGGDGVELAGRLGADMAVDGRRVSVNGAIRHFLHGEVDAALVTAGGEAAEEALAAVRDRGRVAYPHGVEPAPRGRAGLDVQGYDGMPDRPTIEKLNRLISAGPFEVHIARVFPLAQAAEALRALESHYLGKLALRPDVDVFD